MATMGYASDTARNLMEAHGLWADGWRFEFDNGRRRFGCCRYGPRVISLSRYLVRLNSEDEVRNTILHEIAHALVGPGVGHGPEWKRMARRIGADPQRTHDSTTVPGRYLIECNRCGRSLGTRHRKSRGVYTHTGCGGVIEWIDTGLRHA